NVQELIEQLLHDIDRAADIRDDVPFVGRQLRFVQSFGQETERVQRLSQIMTRHREEAGLGDVRLVRCDLLSPQLVQKLRITQLEVQRLEVRAALDSGVAPDQRQQDEKHDAPEDQPRDVAVQHTRREKRQG